MLFRLVLVLALLNLTACSMFRHRSMASNDDMKVTLKDKDGNIKEVAPASGPKVSDGKVVTPIHPDAEVSATPAIAATATPPTMPVEADGKKEATEIKDAVAAAAQHIQQNPAKAERQAGAVPAEKALGWLQHGNTRFVKGSLRRDGAGAKDRARLVAGQTPHAVVISSSDSRFPPEVIFDQKLGEIFVIRSMTNVLDKSSIEATEYAVDHLGTNLIVIMDNESEGKIDSFAKDLLLRSEILRDAVTSGEVKIARAMYHLDTGKVDWR